MAIMMSSAQVAARAQEIDELNAQFKAQVNSLEEKEGSLKSMYEGDAATAFHNAFTRDKVQMDNFYNCIAQYAAVLREIASRMEQAEAINRETATTRAY